MENALQQLVESGILGVLLVLSFSAVIYLYREVSKITSERIADYKEVIAKTQQAQAEQRQLLVQIVDLIKNAK